MPEPRATQSQLHFPFLEPSPARARAVRRSRLEARVPAVSYRVGGGARRLELQLELRLPAGAPVKRSELALELFDEPSCTLDGAPKRWPLWRGIPAIATPANDPFRALLNEIHVARRIFQAELDDALAVRRVDRELDEAFAGVRAAAMLAADRATALGPARALALRFLPHARWFAYAAIAGDRTGRIAQLAAVCPGAIVFALALEEHGMAEHAAALFARVRRGERLGRVLDAALEAWAWYARGAAEARAREGGALGRRAPEEARAPRGDAPRLLVARRAPDEAREAVPHGRGTDPVGTDPVALPWRRLASASGGTRSSILAAQRLLIRRASALVPTTLLWLPPPIAFAPEDVPPTPRAAAAWFRVMKTRAIVIREDERMDPRAREGLSRFLSRHAKALAAEARARRQTIQSLAGELILAVLATGAPLTRSASLAALLRAMDTSRRRARLRALEHDLARERRGRAAIEPLDGDTPLPAPLPPSWSTSARDCTIRAITTVGDLFDEGEQMRHCVASYALAAIRGRRSFWTARIRGTPLTFEIAPSDAGWTILQARGRANRMPTAAENAALLEWLATVSAFDASGCSGDGAWVIDED